MVVCNWCFVNIVIQKYMEVGKGREGGEGGGGTKSGVR